MAVLKCNSAVMRKNLLMVESFQQAGIDFVPVPVVSKQHKERLISDAMASLDTMAAQQGDNLPIQGYISTIKQKGKFWTIAQVQSVFKTGRSEAKAIVRECIKIGIFDMIPDGHGQYEVINNGDSS